MKRLNNKGFAISTILFSILILATLVFGALYTTMIYDSTDKADKYCPKDCPNCICPPDPIDEVDDKCTDEFIIGTEHFCVLYKDSSYVVALAKYNLNVGCKESDANCDYTRIISGEPEGLQSKQTKNSDGSKGTVAALNILEVGGNRTGFYGFYDMINIPSNVTKYNKTSLRNIDTLYNGMADPLRKYVNDYKVALENIISTQKLGISNITVRLLNIDDLSDTKNFDCIDVYNKRILDYNDDIGHGNVNWYCTTNINNEWIFWTDYWTGIILQGLDSPVNTITISGTALVTDQSGTSDDVNGVRPVIEISKSDFDKMPKA